MARTDHEPDHEATERSPLLTSPLLTSRPDVPVSEITDADAIERNTDVRRTKVSGIRGISIVLSLGILVFIQTANISLITTIQSPIADDLKAYRQVSWLTSAYLIAMSSAPAIAGRFSELFGPGGYTLVSSTILAIGILITATASNFNWFLVGRAIAGLGTAGNFPVGVIVIIELTSVKRRGLFMGLLNAGFTTGLAMGAVIAGALEPHVGWRAVFWLQIPFILAAGLGLFFAFPRGDTTEKDKTKKSTVLQKLKSVDYLGVVTLVSSVVLLLYSLSAPKITIVPIVFSLILLIIFILVEAKYAATPIIPISVIRSRSTLMTCFATQGMMMARYLVTLYSPVYFMTTRSWSPVHAGLSLIAVNGGFAVGGLLVGWLHIRRAGSFYVATLVTFVIFTVVYFTTSAISSTTTPVPIFLAMIFTNGLATGAALNYTLVHLLHLTPPSFHSIATSVTAMFRGFGGSFGSAIGGGIFARLLQGALERGFDERGMKGEEELITKLLGSPRLVATLSGVEKEIAVNGYTVAIKGLFFAGAMLAVLATVFQAGAGWTGPPPEKDASTGGNVSRATEGEE